MHTLNRNVALGQYECAMKIGSEIGPYKMGNCFEYEAGQEKSGKDHYSKQRKKCCKKECMSIAGCCFPGTPPHMMAPVGRSKILWPRVEFAKFSWNYLRDYMGRSGPRPQGFLE